MIRFFAKSLLMGVALMWPFTSSAGPAADGSAYDYSFNLLVSNKPLQLSQYKGKVLLVVNTASECAFTGQYKGLEALYEKYRARGLVIVGVPSNDFGSQESGSSEKIADFCQINYGVTFPMTSKVLVKGEAAHPFYKWTQAHFGLKGAPMWNFHKYLIDRNGKPVDYFYSTTDPESPRLLKAIESLLSS